MAELRAARYLVAGAVLAALAGCGDDGASTTTTDTDTDASDATAAPEVDAPLATDVDGFTDVAEPTSEEAGPTEPLAADAGPNVTAQIDAELTLDGSGSTGAVSWTWSLDDGRTVEGEVITVAYAAAGVYQAVLTVRDAAGSKRTDAAVVTIVHPTVHTPSQSSTIARLPGDDLRIVAVDEDADALDWIALDADGATFAATHHVATAARPRTLTPWGPTALVVVCQDAGVVQVHASDGSGVITTIELGIGARPYGAAIAGGDVFVSLQATGQLARIAGDPSGSASLIELFDAVPDARGVAALPDGRVAVSRWRSPDNAAEIALLDPASGNLEIRSLAFSDITASDTGSGGVPSYLDQLLVSPDGRQLALPSTQANHAQGAWLTGTALTHETTVRAALSRWDLIADAEKQRETFDNRGLASAGVFTSDGQWLFVAMRGTRAVVRLDADSSEESGTLLDVGFAPAGLALSADDRWLFVDVPLSREIAVYDVGSFSPPPTTAHQRIQRPGDLPFGDEILRGKQLFNDSADPRLSADGYISCAHCHLDGEADLRTWDFTDRGEGLRNTISLLGRRGAAHGPIHWSGNFDEIHDFEHDIRGPFGGSGLLDDADWEAGTTHQTLGDAKAGKSADLDALAAYVSSLDTFPPSPHRAADGSLTEAAVRGKALFESEETGCTGCHAGSELTDSAFIGPEEPLLHDVGTLVESSGQRLGSGPLPGVDTPTLYGLWNSAPYLHDGSAATLQEVLVDRNPADAHGVTSHLDDNDLQDLETWLLSL